MALVYFFQCKSHAGILQSGNADLYQLADLDKQSINQAAIFGLRDDLHLTGEQFSWAVSLFYLGQLCSEYPAAYLLSRLPITLYVGCTIVVWGGVNMAMAACQTFQGLAAARFFLGFTEGISSVDYNGRREHGLINTHSRYRNRFSRLHHHHIELVREEGAPNPRGDMGLHERCLPDYRRPHDVRNRTVQHFSCSVAHVVHHLRWLDILGGRPFYLHDAAGYFYGLVLERV